MTVRSTFSAHRRLVAGLSTLALATAGLTVVATNARFTTAPANVATGTFTTGTIVLGATAGTAIAFANMAPGDQIFAPITVSNTGGTLPMRYAVTSAPLGTLAANLDLEIRKVPLLTDCVAGSAVPTGWALGTVVRTSTPFNTTAIIGLPAVGDDLGDRTLAAMTGSEVLCVNVILPLAETTQLLTAASATFTFHAEQTTNNP